VLVLTTAIVYSPFTSIRNSLECFRATISRVRNSISTCGEGQRQYQHETKYFHSSTFAELEDGRILHADGTAFTTSSDGGISWSEPVEKHDPDGALVGGGGTSLVRLTGAGVGLSVIAQDTAEAGRIILPLYGMLGQRPGPGDVRPPFSGKLIRGQWVSTAAHFFDPRFSFVYVYYSDDEGRNWQRNHDGELVILRD